MIPLPTWMRRALFAAAAMNVLAAAGFLPAAGPLRAAAGFPEDAHPFYLLTVGMFVVLFGIGYLWTALVGHADRLFIALAAAGKLSFFALLVHLWSAGALPIRAPVMGSGDLVFGTIFVAWLLTARAHTAGQYGARAALPAEQVRG